MCVRPACYIPAETTPSDIARQLIARRWLGTLAEAVALGLFVGSILLVHP